MLDAEVDTEAIAEQDLRPAAGRDSAELRPALLQQMTRAFLAIVAVACAAVGLLLLVDRGASGAGGLTAAIYAVLALCSALAIRLPENRIAHALTLVLTALTVLLAATALALGWVWNNRLVHGLIGGPRTLAQWQDYLDALQQPFDAEDEAFLSGLVSAGHASTPGYTDAQYPVTGRQPRSG